MPRQPFALLLLLSPTAALLPGLVGVVNYKASSRALRIAARGGVDAHSAAGGGGRGGGGGSVAARPRAYGFYPGHADLSRSETTFQRYSKRIIIGITI